MTVGLELKSDTGGLLLTALRANPILRAKSTVTTVFNDLNNSHLGSRADISYTNASATSRPILFMGADISFFVSTADKIGDTWFWFLVVAAPVGTVVTYYVFDEAISFYTNIGVEIYADAPGLPVLFSTSPNFKPLRIAGITAGVYPAGRNYAVAAGRRAGSLTWQPGAKPDANSFPNPSYYALIGTAKTYSIVGNTAGGGGIRLDPPASQQVGTDTPDYSLERDYPRGPTIVADVTGY